MEKLDAVFMVAYLSLARIVLDTSTVEGLKHTLKTPEG